MRTVRLGLLFLAIAVFTFLVVATLMPTEGPEPPSGEASSPNGAIGTEPPEPVRPVADRYRIVSGELIEMRNELAKRKQEGESLKTRERRIREHAAELAKRKGEYDGLKKSVEGYIDVLEQTKQQIERSFVEIKSVEARNIRRLASAYESMEPSSAAEVVASMDIDVATKLLYVMDERKSGKVLAALAQINPERAKELSQKMTTVREETEAETVASE